MDGVDEALTAQDGNRVNGAEDTKPRTRRPTKLAAATQVLPKQWQEALSSTARAKLGLKVNFHKLDTNSLRKYRRFYKLPDVSPDATKENLVMAVGRHFSAQNVDEQRVINAFLGRVRNSSR
ncbi:unnamed protein product [Pedinophyceae sp. YPF-701]|nr:unnamed protein product [Pedinophyceae sp. YPF-701]